LEDQEGRGRKKLAWLLGKQVVNLGGGWNWVRTVCNGGLWN